MSYNFEIKQSCQREIQLFMIGLALSLVAKGVALFPIGHSVDSYPKLVAMSENASQAAGVFDEFVAQGRVGQWAMNKVLGALGIVGPNGNTLYIFLTLCCLVAVGVLLCRFWRIETNWPLQICVVGIVAIHPYHAEIFTFREASLCVGLALLLGMTGLVVAGRTLYRWVAGWALLMISLSLYQVTLNYVVIALIVLCLLELSRSELMLLSTYPPTGAGQQFQQDVMPRAAAIVAALVAYLAAHKLSLQFVSSASSSAELHRSAIIPWSHIPERLRELILTLWHLFAVSEPLMPTASKLLIGVLALLAFVILARSSLAKTGFICYLEVIVIFFLLSLALLAIMGVLIPLDVWFVPDRTLSAVSILVAGFLAIIVMNGGIVIKRFALAVAFVLLFSFTGVNNVVLSEQFRLNKRDMETANRMIMRLETDKSFSKVKKIAVIGSKREYPLRFLTVKDGSDVNVSAFAKTWSKVNVIREVSGYHFLEPSPQDLGRAEDYCRGAGPWPDPTSVVILNDTAVICLTNK